MANDGQIVFEVTADGKHAIADIKEITRAIQQETGKWDKETKTATDSMGNNFSGMLKKLVAGFSAVKIGKALLDIGSAAVDAASDLAEVQNVVDVTFGDNANKIEKWAKNAGSQFGLTETQAKRFSSTMGAMLKSSGLAGDKIVDVSTDLAGLAADMASFYNLDFDEAFSKIRSGMSGMAMPLKELGIDMSETALKAFAMEQGFSKSFDSMSAGEKTLVRYQYLMQVTADAQGDFSRTADEFANSKRRFITNVESIKTALGKTFINACTDAMNAVNDFLGSLLPDESKRTVLDDFLDIDAKTEAKIAEIQKVKKEADDLNTVLTEIFKTDDTDGTDAADTVSKLGVKSEETAEYLKSLGFSTEEIDEKERDWLETCKRLVKTIPGLSELINTETGEVKGGTQAVKDYIDAWAKGQEKLAMLGALEEKESALSSKFSDLPGLKLDMAVAQKRARDARKKLADLYGTVFDESGKILDRFSTENKYKFESGLFNVKEVEDAFEAYNKLISDETEKVDAYKIQVDAYEEAKAALEEYRETIVETYGSIEEANNAGVEWSQDLKDAAAIVADAAQQALTNLADYAEGVRDAVEKAVDSTVKGFSKIETPMMKNREKVKELDKEIANLDTTSKTYEKDLKKLNDEIAKQRGEQLSAQSIGMNLEQQNKFMQDYLDNMRKARDLGFSNDVLAALSDGSEDSYDVLEQLAQASPDEVKKINDAYQSVIDKKAELTKELTGQQLTVDKTYQSMAEKAAEAVAALDLEGTAKENSGKTVKGIVEGIKSHVSEVTEQVDAIIAQLDRLAGVGVSVDVGGVNIPLIKPGMSHNTRNRQTGNIEGAFASGIDFVPKDMYARIHEGESILKAEEAAIYREWKHNGGGFDYDTMGGVMRDNIKPGGDVYLDGKAVGNVISDRQGRAFRSLQRSGWQQ